MLQVFKFLSVPTCCVSSILFTLLCVLCACFLNRDASF